MTMMISIIKTVTSMSAASKTHKKFSAHIIILILEISSSTKIKMAKLSPLGGRPTHRIINLLDKLTFQIIQDIIRLKLILHCIILALFMVYRVHSNLFL